MNLLLVYIITGMMAFLITLKYNDVIEGIDIERMTLADVFIMFMILFYSPCFLIILSVKWSVQLLTVNKKN